MYEEDEEEEDLDWLGEATRQAAEIGVNLDAELKARRPDRYEPDDKDWMEPVISSLADQLVVEPPEALAHKEARRRVFAVERRHALRLNGFLRSLGIRPPLWTSMEEIREAFTEYQSLPLAVGDVRVRFGRAEPEDFEQWAMDTAKEEDARREAKREEERGAQFVADALRRFDLCYPEAAAA